jgi:hypothetical protein
MNLWYPYTICYLLNYYFFIIHTYIHTDRKQEEVLLNLRYTYTVSYYFGTGDVHKEMTLSAAMRLKPGPKSGKGGRPPKEDSLHTTIKINARVKEMLDSERREGERYSDTILRTSLEKAAKIKELQQALDQSGIRLKGGIPV